MELTFVNTWTDCDTMRRNDNMILNEYDARRWIALWVAQEGRIRPGILQATITGLRMALSIMNGSPSRYSTAERLDTQEAIAYLESEDWSVRR